MRPTLVLLLVGASAGLVVPSTARAAWTQPVGATYLKLWDHVLAGSRVFGLDGQILDLGQSYQDHALRLYLEHGVAERLTVVARATPLGLASSGEETTAYAGLLGLGARIGLVTGQVPVALELGYGYAPPLGATAVAAGALGDQAYRYQPALERHVGTVELQVGTSWRALWAVARVGTTFVHGDGLDPALDAGLRLGFSTGFGLSGDGGVSVHEPFRDPTLIDVTGIGNTRYVGIDLGIGYALTDQVGLRVELGLAPYAESNAATPSLGVGLELRR
jgi:hypothetical protein